MTRPRTRPHSTTTPDEQHLGRLSELRAAEPQRRAEYARFVTDLKGAREWLEGERSPESQTTLGGGTPTQAQERPVQIGAPVAEHEPVVA